MIEVDLSRVVNNDIHGRRQLFELRIWKSPLAFAVVSLDKFHSWQIQIALKTKIRKAFILSFPAICGTIQAVDLHNS